MVNDYCVTIEIPCIPVENERLCEDMIETILYSEPLFENPDINISIEKVGEWLDL